MAKSDCMVCHSKEKNCRAILVDIANKYPVNTKNTIIYQIKLLKGL
jgi:hypothetical protein